MNKYILVTIFLCLFLVGCVSTGVKPTVLTSKEQMWTIPAGATFQATQAPTYKKITTFVAPEDLSVIYKGKLLELEQAADKKVIDTSRAAKQTGIIWGALGTIVTVLGGLITKFFINKATTPKTTATEK